MGTAAISALAATWNNGGTTFTGIGLDVTDSASAAGSKLLDLKVGGSSKFTVTKDGRATATRLTANPILENFDSFYVDGAGVRTSATGWFGFASSGLTGGAPDVYLYRDAAGVMAQRNGANAQAFRVYNTFTDASNYERGKFAWSSNVLQIGTEKAGTGSARAIEFQTDGTTRASLAATGATFTVGAGNGRFGIDASTDWATYLKFNGTSIATITNLGTLGLTAAGAQLVLGAGSGNVGIANPAASVIRVTNASTGGGALQFTEMTAPAAPSADNVCIYAEDNGSGKTRLMARFNTGAAVQLAIEP